MSVASSAWIACSIRSRAPLRRTSVNGSDEKPDGSGNWVMVVSDMWHIPFSAENLRRLDTAMICRPSGHHQLSRVSHCPIAHISVVEDDTQWYKSVVGIELDRMPKDNSFCAHTIMSGEPMVVPDLSTDPRFEAHPMVAEGGPGARFYAGVPRILSSGQR